MGKKRVDRRLNAKHRSRVRQVIRGLVESSDIQKVMEDTALTPVSALRLLRGEEGRQQLKARRQLAKIHGELLAQRFGPFAVQKLTQLLGDEKPELRLKGALSLLKIGGLDKQPRTTKTTTKNEELPEDTEELREMMAVVAEVLERRTANTEAS